MIRHIARIERFNFIYACTGADSTKTKQQNRYKYKPSFHGII